MLWSKTTLCFYPEEIVDRYEKSGRLPGDAAKIDESLWIKYGIGAAPSGYERGADENGRPVWVEIPPAPIDEAASRKLREVASGYEAELDAILSQYPATETKTWDKQEAEARAYQADSSAATPLVDAIAEARGLDKSDLVSRIIAKANAWVARSGSATGKRQRLEDEIKAAEEAGDRDALERIAW